jgi:hypothetical protein
MKFYIILLLTIVITIVNSKLISIVVMPGTSIQGSKELLQNAYLRHLYSITSSDMMEIRVENSIVMSWTRVTERTKILNAILNTDLSRNKPCVEDYPFDSITPGTNTVYLITDKEPCRSQVKIAARLKQSGTIIFPIGIGRGISSNTLLQISGPCMGVCIKGYNYLHIG